MEGGTGCRYTVHVWSLLEDGTQHRGDSPTLFREEREFFKVPRIGLVKVERLGQRLNVPTQGRRVA